MAALPPGASLEEFQAFLEWKASQSKTATSSTPAPTPTKPIASSPPVSTPEPSIPKPSEVEETHKEPDNAALPAITSPAPAGTVETTQAASKDSTATMPDPTEAEKEAISKRDPILVSDTEGDTYTETAQVSRRNIRRSNRLMKRELSPSLQVPRPKKKNKSVPSTSAKPKSSQFQCPAIFRDLTYDPDFLTANGFGDVVKMIQYQGWDNLCREPTMMDEDLVKDFYKGFTIQSYGKTVKATYEIKGQTYSISSLEVKALLGIPDEGYSEYHSSMPKDMSYVEVFKNFC